MTDLQDKYNKLVEFLKQYNKIAVCYSAGTASTLLLKASIDAVGNKKVCAFTAHTDFYTEDELISAKKICKKMDVLHLSVRVHTLENAQIAINDENRCYHCKKNVLSMIKEQALMNGCEVLIEGTDVTGYSMNKPGGIAANEAGVVCPLSEIGIDRTEAALLLRELGLRQYVVPENPCLATRISTGQPINTKNLRAVCALESMLHKLGFDFVRVRLNSQPGWARIEVPENRYEEMTEKKDFILSEFSEFGYDKVEISVYKRVERC